MKAVVMAGGRATRLNAPQEKPLLKVGEEGLLDRTMRVLRASRAEDIQVAVTGWSPRTRERCIEKGYPFIDTPGADYHGDVHFLLSKFGPYVSVNVDIPFLEPRDIDALLSKCGDVSIACAVPLEEVDWPVDDKGIGIGATGKEHVWVGLNFVTASPDTEVLLMDEPLLALNINTLRDVEIYDELQRKRCMRDFNTS